MAVDRRCEDATALAAAFSAGETDPVEAMGAALDRMERLNPALNAVIHPRPQRALLEAGEASQRWAERRAGRNSGVPMPLDGVPIAIKDLGCEQAGECYHVGARFLVDLGWRGSVDSHLYRQLRRTGLISLGRTNTPEFGTTITTEPATYGATANPWALHRSPGGSSGGSAAAVAAGIVPVAHGNDGGGSIRIPAAACGLVGLKPTRGRVSTAPRLGEHRGGFAVDGMITRTVRDTAACLDIISIPAPGDPYAAAPLGPDESFFDALALAAAVPSLRIAVSSGPQGRASEPVRHALNQAATLLEGLGHCIEPDIAPKGWFSPEFADSAIVVRTVAMATELSVWGKLLGRTVTADDIEPANWWSAELGRSLPAVAYLGALEELARWRRQVMAFWQPDGFDLLLTPVLADVTPEIGYLADPADGARRVAELAAFVNQANISGQPAISLPTAHDPFGLPLGVQLHAGHGKEQLLIAVAQQIAAADGLIPLGDLPHTAAPTDANSPEVARAPQSRQEQQQEQEQQEQQRATGP